jgi:hypothetical protein
MSAWIATALTVAITAMSAAVTAVDAGPCAPGRTRNCLNIPATMDFSSVPEISKQIVGPDKVGEKQNQPTSEPPPAPIRVRFLGSVRDQDDCRLLAIPGHWSDGHDIVAPSGLDPPPRTMRA